MQTFPRWTNKIPAILAAAVGLGGAGAVLGIWYYFSPSNTDVGYEPKQPVPYSHKLHAGDLGIDCRYCHTGVEKSAVASVPPTQTCMNCHTAIRTDSVNLAPVRESWANDTPIEWVKIHKIPDYAQFPHNAHINAGVGCVSCHGRIDQMVKVRQHEPLSMGWCLDCHRNPQPNLRPVDKVTQMDWSQSKASPDELARINKDVHPPVNCSGCHK